MEEVCFVGGELEVPNQLHSVRQVTRSLKEHFSEFLVG